MKIQERKKIWSKIITYMSENEFKSFILNIYLDCWKANIKMYSFQKNYDTKLSCEGASSPD